MLSFRVDDAQQDGLLWTNQMVNPTKRSLAFLCCPAVVCTVTVFTPLLDMLLLPELDCQLHAPS